MSIYHQASLPSGSVLGYHRVMKAEADFESGELSVIVQSWTDRPTFLLGARPDMSAYVLTFDAFPDVEQALVEFVIGPFYGGLVEVETNTEIEIARARRWADVKRWRMDTINETMTTPYGVIQCTPEDRQNVTDAIMLSQTLTNMGQPTLISWTLADNTTVDLDLTQLITVGLLLGQRVQVAHAHARTLRATIDAAETVTDIQGVVW